MSDDVVKRKATNVQFSPEQTEEILAVMKDIGIESIADFVKFSCKQVCNMVQLNGVIPYQLNKKISVKGSKLEK